MCANADACFACAVLGAPPRVPHPYVPAIRSFRGGLGTHAVDDAHGEWSGSSLFPLRSPLPPRLRAFFRIARVPLVTLNEHL